jgi:hypothetical protein
MSRGAGWARKVSFHEWRNRPKGSIPHFPFYPRNSASHLALPYISDRPPSFAAFPSKRIVFGRRTEKERDLESIVYFVVSFF